PNTTKNINTNFALSKNAFLSNVLTFKLFSDIQATYPLSNQMKTISRRFNRDVTTVNKVIHCSKFVMSAVDHCECRVKKCGKVMPILTQPDLSFNSAIRNKYPQNSYLRLFAYHF
ncbi:hypothetical protein J4G37_40875, partial [Microvirga sp. 3-52]|nr:hypothetical protein [Microvirga sp. 3-52]